MDASPPPAKMDLKQVYKALYTAPANRIVLLETPPLQVLAVDGMGDPSGPIFAEAVNALYALAYTLKFERKRQGLLPDYSVLPLEALWWANDMASFAQANRDAWQWTAFIVQPDFIAADEVERARAVAARKKTLPALPGVTLRAFAEGTAAQIMHVGPYATEPPTIARLHAWIAEQGLQLAGKHHEIYLSDPGRTAPEKMKTILRQPVAR